MEYTIISKVEFIGGNVRYTEVGYTADEVLCNTINSDYESTLGAWVETNKSELESGTKFISEFFDGTPYVHVARTRVDYETDLPEITNIDQL